MTNSRRRFPTDGGVKVERHEHLSSVPMVSFESPFLYGLNRQPSGWSRRSPSGPFKTRQKGTDDVTLWSFGIKRHHQPGSLTWSSNVLWSLWGHGFFRVRFVHIPYEQSTLSVDFETTSGHQLYNLKHIRIFKVWVNVVVKKFIIHKWKIPYFQDITYKTPIV